MFLRDRVYTKDCTLCGLGRPCFPSKTKDVFTAYRQSGYSTKFYESNLEDILLHQSAKRAFDRISSDKIPTLRELQLEFNVCRDEKKAKLKDYALQKKSMKEPLTVKSNIDHLFSQKAIGQDQKQR